MQEEKAAVLLSRAAVEGFEGNGLQRGGRFSAGLCGRQGGVVRATWYLVAVHAAAAVLAL